MDEFSVHNPLINPRLLDKYRMDPTYMQPSHDPVLFPKHPESEIMMPDFENTESAPESLNVQPNYMKYALNTVADFIPGIGDIKGVKEGISGVDATGEPVPNWARPMGMIPFVGALKDISRGVRKPVSEIIELAKLLKSQKNNAKPSLLKSIVPPGLMNKYGKEVDLQQLLGKRPSDIPIDPNMNIAVGKYYGDELQNLLGEDQNVIFLNANKDALPDKERELLNGLNLSTHQHKFDELRVRDDRTGEPELMPTVDNIGWARVNDLKDSYHIGEFQTDLGQFNPSDFINPKLVEEFVLSSIDGPYNSEAKVMDLRNIIDYFPAQLEQDLTSGKVNRIKQILEVEPHISLSKLEGLVPGSRETLKTYTKAYMDDVIDNSEDNGFFNELANKATKARWVNKPLDIRNKNTTVGQMGNQYLDTLMSNIIGQARADGKKYITMNTPELVNLQGGSPPEFVMDKNYMDLPKRYGFEQTSDHGLNLDWSLGNFDELSMNTKVNRLSRKYPHLRDEYLSKIIRPGADYGTEGKQAFHQRWTNELDNLYEEEFMNQPLNAWKLEL